MLNYDVVDVFTDRAFAGNPLAVVHGGVELDTAAMQAIAREFNLSETAFPLPPGVGADYRVRFFTPLTELAFAGHPSVGTAWVLARDGVITHGEVVQECGAGLLPVVVDAAGAAVTGGPPRIGPALDATPLAAAAAARAHVRMFGPGVDVDEDPATGAAAVALGVWLVDRGLLAADGSSAFTIRQGAEIGRPSRLDVTVDAVGGAAVRTSVRGGVVPVARGQIVEPSSKPRRERDATAV